MKFLDIIKTYENNLLVEQDVPPPPPPPPAETQPAQPPAPEVQQPEEKEPEKIDLPPVVVTLGRLLKKALITKMSDEDASKVASLPEINEKNANDVIDKIIAIMKSYSADVDIDNNPKTTT